MIDGVSLFSSSGLGELYFRKAGIKIRIANEIIPERAKLYHFLYPDVEMIVGDICNENIFNYIDEEIKKNNCKFLIATPPCQGMSTLGKKDYSNDKRNFLIFYVLDLIENNNFDYILLENVPKFLNLFFCYDGELLKIEEILKRKFSEKYNIVACILNAEYYGVPQSRPRSIIRMWKRDLFWNEPIKKNIVTLRDCIGDLPSLESGEKSDIKWHYAKVHNEREVLAMKHTPEGKSALNNDVYFPKKANGEKIKGFHNTYKRMKRDEPCPTRAMNNGNMGGHNNVHPGRPLPDGTFSDARVLTLRELFIVSSLPPDWNLPSWCSDSFIRKVVGEGLPPMFSYEIVKGIMKL